MQQIKGINNLSEINKTCNNLDLLASGFARGLKEFNLS
jgi:aspartate ammonia-lyase